MSSGARAQLFATPYARARRPLHDPPEILFRVEFAEVIQPFVPDRGEDALPVVEGVPVGVFAPVHLPIEHNLLTFSPLVRRQLRRELHAVGAHQPANAEFDEIAVEKHGPKSLQVPGIGLQHGDPRPGPAIVALVVILGFQAVRD